MADVFKLRRIDFLNDEINRVQITIESETHPLSTSVSFFYKDGSIYGIDGGVCCLAHIDPVKAWLAGLGDLMALDKSASIDHELHIKPGPKRETFRF